MSGDAAPELLREALDGHGFDEHTVALVNRLLLPVVEAECRRRAAEELRLTADLLRAHGQHVLAAAVENRADAIEGRT